MSETVAMTVASSGGGPVCKARIHPGHVTEVVRDFVRVSATCRPGSGVAITIREAA